MNSYYLVLCRISSFVLALSLAVMQAACTSTPPGSICANYGSRISCSGGLYWVYAGDRLVTKHEGIDYRGEPGTPVYATTNGTIYRIRPERIEEPCKHKCGGVVSILTDIDLTKANPSSETKTLVAQHLHIVPLADLKKHSAVRAGDLIGHIQDFDTIEGGPSNCTGKTEHVHVALHSGSWIEREHVNPHDYAKSGSNKLTCLGPAEEPQSGVMYQPFRCSDTELSANQ